MIKGTAFWRKDSDGQQYHLRIVISEPDSDSSVLVVGISTCRNRRWEDESCILDAGEHPKITSRSYVRYDKAFEIDYSSLIAERFSGAISLLAGVSDEVLRKIQSGARKSRALPRLFRKYFDYF